MDQECGWSTQDRVVQVDIAKKVNLSKDGQHGVSRAGIGRNTISGRDEAAAKPL